MGTSPAPGRAARSARTMSAELARQPKRVLKWIASVIADEEFPEILDSVEEAATGEAWALYNLGNWATGESNRFLGAALLAVAAARGEDDAWRNLGNCLDALGLPDPALVAWEVAARRGDEGAAVHAAMEREERGELLEAEALYRLAPGEEWTPVRRARVLRALGRPVEADALIVEDRSRNWAAAAQWSKMPGVVARDAIALLEAHLQNGADEACIRLADLYEEVGDVDRAIATLRRSVSAGEPFAPHNLAVTLWENGRRGYLPWFLLAASEGDAMSMRWLRRKWGPTWRVVPGRFVRRARRDADHPAEEFEHPLTPAEDVILALAARARTLPDRFVEVRVYEPEPTKPYRDAALTTKLGTVVWFWDDHGGVAAGIEKYRHFRVSVPAPDDWRPEAIDAWVDGLEAKLLALNRTIVTRLRERRRRKRARESGATSTGGPKAAMLEIPPGVPSLSETLTSQRDAERY